MPQKKAVVTKDSDNYLVYLGEDYKATVTKRRACGLFLGSKDGLVCEIDVSHQVARSHLAIQAMDAMPGDLVILIDQAGFYLMDRSDAMEIAGLLESV